jgi:hypothetical protein
MRFHTFLMALALLLSACLPKTDAQPLSDGALQDSEYAASWRLAWVPSGGVVMHDAVECRGGPSCAQKGDGSKRLWQQPCENHLEGRRQATGTWPVHSGF